MLKSNPLLSLVVPLYNEEENVSILCEKVERALTNYKYELILIDDCSCLLYTSPSPRDNR